LIFIVIFSGERSDAMILSSVKLRSHALPPPSSHSPPPPLPPSLV
jgi:hypothetical protein